MVRSGDITTGADQARQVVTELPEPQRIDMILEVARTVARAVPVQQRRRPGVTDLHDVLALPATPGR